MKMEVTKGMFCRMFADYGREDNFSREAREMIFDYLEGYDPDSEVDIIAVCCEFSEESAEVIAESYGINIYNCKNDGEVADVVRDYLEDNTTLVGETDVGFVYVDF